jgi:DNA-binding MarR family transcriptional regulator
MSETIEDVGLATALVGLSHHVLHLFADVGRNYKLSQQQVELICTVIVRGKVGMAELGRLMQLEKSNLSNVVDRLEQRGLATRTRDPHDRRAVWVELTSEGAELAMQTHGEVTARLHRLVNKLPIADQRHLTAVVQQLMTDETP